MKTGHALWLFGLSGAGKSTLASALQNELSHAHFGRPLMLDGDRLRRGLSDKLGFSDSDRIENLRRAAEITRIGVESGLLVISSFITPSEHSRDMVRRIVGAHFLSFIYLTASVEVCRRRDTKGIYAASRAGHATKVSGIDSIFEAPKLVDLTLDTGTESLVCCADSLVAYTRQKLGLGLVSTE